MLWLYFVARMFLNLFSPKMALNLYFLGAISGGILYLLFFEFLPKGRLGVSLVGASASVMAILIFLCAICQTKKYVFLHSILSCGILVQLLLV
ncbi:rhomboid family intramembrane serine protease [Jejuia pallidilutea]